MATFAALKGDLIASLGELRHSGTATGGAAGTLIDTNSLTYEDDELNDLWIYVHAGKCLGQERRIYDFDQSSNTASVTPNWTTDTPDATTKYYIYQRRFNNAAYEAGFKQALRLLRGFFLLPLEDATNALGDPALAASYSVTVPTGMVAIHQIIREDLTLDDVYTVLLPGPADNKAPWWTVSRSGSTYSIVFDRAAQREIGFMVEGRDIKIVGQQFQAEPTTDASTITINAGPIIELAAMLLSARDIRQPDLAYIYTNRLTKLFADLGGGAWPGSVIVESF